MKVKNINSECESTSSSSTAQNMKISWEVPQQNKCIKYSNDYFIATTSEVINGICSIGVTKIEPKHGKGCGDTLSILGNVVIQGDLSANNISGVQNGEAQRTGTGDTGPRGPKGDTGDTGPTGPK